MTVVPLPASPCLRVRLIYTEADGTEAGSRFFLSYTGTAPTPANCVTLANDIATAWSTTMANLVTSGYSLTSVDVLDIASDTGASGVITCDYPGLDTGPGIPSSAAINVEFGIARRYRGGKPRMFIPPPAQSTLLNGSSWTSAFTTDIGTQVTAFFTAVTALSVGAVGVLTHVSLSYYKGFTNIENSSGRERAAPTYRATALVDVVESIIPKQTIGSQRRRLRATTP